MPRTPKGEISKRLKAKAIRLLGATVDDESAPIYLRVMSARSLLAQPKPEPKPAADEGEPIASTTQRIVSIDGREFVQIGNGPKVVLLPYNSRKYISAEDRERERLERLAELPMADVDEPQLAEPQPRKLTGKERLRLMRARRRAMREAD
jgi:hypothetical protein